MIALSINFANENHVDKIVVSTDDAFIKEIALKYGTEVIDRPMVLASNYSSTIDTLK
ncbi:MAG: hypothetical protein Q8S41_06120 [Lutibacter sp.]|nr:hypothetical protein [Lutibacter sp.]